MPMSFKIIVSPFQAERPLTPYVKLKNNTARAFSIKENQIVKVTHKSVPIFLRAQFDINEKSFDISHEGTINKKTSALFNGIDYNNSFIVESASTSSISECEILKINTFGNKQLLTEYLKKNDFIVHPITESVKIDGSIVEFKVVDILPKSKSLLVTENTKIEFVETSSANIQMEINAQNSEDSAKKFFDTKEPIKSFGKDVVGMDYIENRVATLVKLFDLRIYDKAIKEFGEKVATKSNSILLYGPPGCGKTLVAEAVANKIKNDLDNKCGKFSYMNVRGSELVSKYSGEPEKNIAQCFEEARYQAKNGFTVLFIDEIDTLIPDRGESNLPKHDRAMTNQFLKEMNNQYDNLLILGATNVPFMIDPAAARRFVTKLFIRPPNPSVLEAIWKLLLNGDGYANINYKMLADATKDYTPAEITDEIFGQRIAPALIEQISSNMENNVFGELKPITTEYLLDYISQSKPTTVAGYISSIEDKINKMGGYPELREYVVSHNEHKINKADVNAIKFLDSIIKNASERNGSKGTKNDEQ